MVERGVRNAEVGSSILLVSTILLRAFGASQDKSCGVTKALKRMPSEASAKEGQCTTSIFCKASLTIGNAMSA